MRRPTLEARLPNRPVLPVLLRKLVKAQIAEMGEALTNQMRLPRARAGQEPRPSPLISVSDRCQMNPCRQEAKE